MVSLLLEVHAWCSSEEAHASLVSANHCVDYKHRCSPLRVALQCANSDAVALLLTHGADPDDLNRTLFYPVNGLVYALVKRKIPNHR